MIKSLPGDLGGLLAQIVFYENTSRQTFMRHLSKIVFAGSFLASIPAQAVTEINYWGRDGKQYGLPKDWDTIAIVYNKTMLDKAGIDPKSLTNFNWNPKDGGTFGQLIAKLTVDANGKTGLDAGFDPKNVKQYGLLIGGQVDGFGQVEWSHLAVSNGFKFYDAPWAKHFNYDDPKLAETIQWIADMELKKGLIVPAKDARQAGANGLFAGQKGALAFVGSWDIHWCKENCKFDIGFVPLPEGPVGRRTMFNGLADSIWVGSKHQEEDAAATLKTANEEINALFE